MFALFHVLCKPLVVKAGVKVSSFAIKLRTGGAVVGRVQKDKHSLSLFKQRFSEFFDVGWDERGNFVGYL